MTSLNPVLHRRPPDRRGAAPPPRPRSRARRATRTIELLELVGIPAPDAADRRVPAPALGRHAPARDDRDGGRLQPEGADRRRADDRARRDDPGRHPRPDARHPRAPRHGDPAHHPRPRRGRRRRRPRDGHVRGAQGRGGAGGRAVRAPAAPVHDRAARRRCRAPGAAAPTSRCRRSPGVVPVARAAARRVRVRAALPARRRRVPSRCRRSSPCGPRHPVGLLPPRGARYGTDAERTPVLEVDGLVKHFPATSGRTRRRRRVADARARRGARPRGRVGQRQVDGRPLHHAAARPDRRARSGSTGTDITTLSRSAAAPAAARAAHGLPGPATRR